MGLPKPRSPEGLDIHPAVEAAWLDYLTARQVAEETRDIRDGMIAGRSWGRWLSLFESQTLKQRGAP